MDKVGFYTFSGFVSREGLTSSSFEITITGQIQQGD